jgi:hypothetical protein
MQYEGREKVGSWTEARPEAFSRGKDKGKNKGGFCGFPHLEIEMWGTLTC